MSQQSIQTVALTEDERRSFQAAVLAANVTLDGWQIITIDRELTAAVGRILAARQVSDLRAARAAALDAFQAEVLDHIDNMVSMSPAEKAVLHAAIRSARATHNHRHGDDPPAGSERADIEVTYHETAYDRVSQDDDGTTYVDGLPYRAEFQGLKAAATTSAGARSMIQRMLDRRSRSRWPADPNAPTAGEFS